MRSRVSISAPSSPLTLDGLYRDYANFVWRSVQRLGIPEPLAPDTVHEVFIVARNKLSTYEGRGSPASWLFGIARGVCANHRRASQRAQRRHPQWSPPAPAPDPEDLLVRRDAQQAIERFLESLPETQRSVFALADIEGLSGPEIAEALELELNAVYSRLRLARRKLETYVANLLVIDVERPHAS